MEFRINATTQQVFDETDKNGRISLPPELIHECIISPLDGHWCTRCVSIPTSQKIDCPIVEDDHLSWWKTVTRIDKVKRESPTNFKVGVIDIGFPSQIAENIRHVNEHGDEFICNYFEDDFHGFNVTHILNTCGLFKKDNISFFNAASKINPNKLDLRKIALGIVNLINQCDVDFINISSGGYFNESDFDDSESLEFLRDKILYAQESGCIIFAAVGNKKIFKPAVPASLNEVLGVGAAGLVGLAPEGTLSKYHESEALKTRDSTGKTEDNCEIFHDITTTCGDGLDLISLGVSIFLEYGGGEVAEFFGTSFASPIALACVAANLENDKKFTMLPLESKLEYVKDQLKVFCEDLNVPKYRQGAGFIRVVEN